MKFFVITIGGILFLFSAIIFKDPLTYWEWNKLGLFLKGIKKAEPTKFYLVMTKIFSFIGICAGIALFLFGIFGNVE